MPLSRMVLVLLSPARRKRDLGVAAMGGGLDWLTTYLINSKYCLRLLATENFVYSIYLVEKSCSEEK
jgi:hypothetical protein